MSEEGAEKAPAEAVGASEAGGAAESRGAISEMSVEELVASFPRRRRGRPSKKDQVARDALKAAQAQPTKENIEQARAAVAAALGDAAARSSEARPAARRAAPEPAAPQAAPEPAEAPAGPSPADAAGPGAQQPGAVEPGPSGQPSAAEPRGAEEPSPAGQAGAPAPDAPQQPRDGAGRRQASGPEQQETAFGGSQRRRRHERRDGGRQPGAAAPQQQRDGQRGAAGQRAREFDQQRPGRDGRPQPGQFQGGSQQRQHDGARPGRGQAPQQQGGSRRNGRGQQQREVAEPKTDRAELEAMTVGDLRAKASELGVEAAGLKKGELIDAVYAAMVREEGFSEFRGILDLTGDGFGFVRAKGYLASESDVYVGASLVRANALRRGDELTGICRLARPNDKFPAACRIASVNGKAPEELKGRPRFQDLTPVFPSEPLKMEHGRDSILGRCIDLVAPIGKGQRGLIVSPPKAGKTTVLKKIAESIAANNPEVHLICLLVDERPEEVTDMQRSIRGEVVASTFDMPSDNHIMVSELVIERAKRLVEQGEDVVVLLDSITRLARAYNLAQPASGRILSGGVDSTALYPPKRFLGAARNIENGGSLTILASALVDTGSKMDEVIFEEFKGTGNMELRLDRDLADRRIFPAIDPIASGTRKEELLLDPSIAPFVWGIRRILAGMNSNERAMSTLIRSLKATSTNEEFLVRSAKKAQLQEMNGDF